MKTLKPMAVVALLCRRCDDSRSAGTRLECLGDQRVRPRLPGRCPGRLSRRAVQEGSEGGAAALDRRPHDGEHRANGCRRRCALAIERPSPRASRLPIADPVSGEVAFQGRLKVQGRDTLAAIRLKVDRGRITEIEQLHAGGIAPQAIELLTTPRAFSRGRPGESTRVARGHVPSSEFVFRRARG